MGIITQEMRRLRKGRGLNNGDLRPRIGEHLRRHAGIGDEDGPAAARDKIVVLVESVSRRMPADLARTLLVSVGLHCDPAARALTDRIALLSVESGRSHRTVQRRLDAATLLFDRLLADQDTERDGFYPHGWRLQRLSTRLRLDSSPVTVTQEREIVAETDGLTTVLLSTSLARSSCLRADCRPEFDVEFGGVLSRVEQPSETYFRYFVELPGPLRLGDVHRIGTSLRMPDGHTFGDRYVFQSQRRCDALDLELRFKRERPPTGVREISGVPTGMVDDATGSGPQVALSAFGEARLTFSGLRRGLAYGATWRIPRPLGWPGELLSGE